MNITTSISLVLGHTFKDNEGIYMPIRYYQYNNAITWPKYKYIGGVLNWKPTGFGGGLTVFGNNRNNTALHVVHITGIEKKDYILFVGCPI